MSRRLSEEEYGKTVSGRLRQWLDGSRDLYIGNMEMKPQPEFCEDKKQEKQRKKENRRVRARIYDTENNPGIQVFNKIYQVLSVLFCILLVCLLLVAVSNLPTTGRSDNPADNEVAARYIENGLQETGSVNIVTGMILDYRAFDTLGESHVLFTATCVVLILLRIDSKGGKKNKQVMQVLAEDSRSYEPKNDTILQTVARFLVPVIILFGIYVILCGHLGPGGGFSGGAVIGAGLILYLLAFGFQKTERFFTAKTYKVTSFCALACYSISKCYSFYTGANGIESVIPLGTPGAILSSGLILVLNICVGVVVAGTMYTFFVMFRKGGY